MTLTIRQHLEAILTETTINEYQQRPRETQEHIRDHAVAALRALDEADEKHYQDEPRYRLVPDPAPPTENT